MLRSASVLLLALALSASTAVAQEPVRPAVAIPGADGQPYLVHAWTDEAKGGDGAPEVRRVEVTIDPATGETVQSVYAPDGRLIARAPTGYATPSQEELDAGAALIARHPELGPMLRAEGVLLDGAFNLRQAKGLPCGPGSRCLQYDLFAPLGWSPARRDRVRRVRFVVVDLVRGRVLFPDAQPGRLGNQAFGPGHDSGN